MANSGINPTNSNGIYARAEETAYVAAEQLHRVFNGTAEEEVMADDGLIPSVRKALVDNFYFLDPIAWEVDVTESVFNQPRVFTNPTAPEDVTYWFAPAATSKQLIPMGGSPFGDDNWQPWINGFDKGNPLISWAYTAETVGQTVINVPFKFKVVGNVFINGVHQNPDEAYEYNKKKRTVTLSQALDLGDTIVIQFGMHGGVVPSLISQLEKLRDETKEDADRAEISADRAENAAENAATDAADEFSQQFQDRFNTLTPIPWTPNTLIKENQSLQVFEHDGLFYLPNVKKLPFTTGATFNADNWILSELLTLNTQLISNGSAVSRSVSDRLLSNSNGVLAEDFGVIFDGKTDSTDAFISLLSYVKINNVPVIFPSTGRCITSRPLHVDGFNLIIRSNGFYTQYNALCVPSIRNTASDMFVVSHQSFIVVEAIALEGNTLKTTKCITGLGNIPDTHSFQVRAKNSLFTSFDLALDGTAGSWLWVIEGCRFYGNDQDAKLVNPNSAIIRGNQWAYLSRIGLELTLGEPVEVVSNEFGFHSDITEQACILDRVTCGSFKLNYLESYGGGTNKANGGDGTYPLVIYSNLYYPTKTEIKKNLFNHNGKYDIVVRKKIGENQNQACDYLIEKNKHSGRATVADVYFDGATDTILAMSERPSDMDYQRWVSSNNKLPMFCYGNKLVIEGAATKLSGNTDLLTDGDFDVMFDNSNGHLMSQQSGYSNVKFSYFFRAGFTVRADVRVGMSTGDRTDYALNFNDYVNPSASFLFADPVKRSYTESLVYHIRKQTSSLLTMQTIQRGSAVNVPESLKYTITVEQLSPVGDGRLDGVVTQLNQPPPLN